MSDGHHAHVSNQVWMRAFLFAAILVTIGLVAYGIFSVGLAPAAHHHWEELEAAHASYEEIEHAHLRFLTWNVAGNTILFMMVIYASFIGLAGLMNSSRPEADHDHDDHGHHGSASPIIMSIGVMLFMMGFPDFANAAEAYLYDGGGAFGDMLLSLIGLSVVMAGVANWWGEDLPFDGHSEQLATASEDMVPFRGQHVRKVGIWVFLMSEVMVFGSFFSSYLRMRTEWCTEWAIKSGVEACQGEVAVATASDFIRGDIATLAPGAINTFALIISSYTIVLALKTAKAKDWTPKAGLMGKLMPTQRVAVGNYLIATLMLGSLFIVLKLIEWSHLIAEGFTIQSQQGSIFYIATGAHGLHVFLGLIVMLYMIFKASLEPEDHGTGWTENNAQGIEYFGLYWHFVDLAWVVIFPAFYLY